LIANGFDLGEATSEALSYLDRCLASGFRPGMGHVLPDRMFWAQSDEDDEGDSIDTLMEEATSLEGFVIPPHDTKH